MVEIPQTVSGRTVTRRGVHLQPFGFHDEWMKRADYWVGLLQSMHMSWCVLLSESDAAVKSGAAEALLDGGVIPIIRFAAKVPNRFTEMKATEQLVALYARYNAPCIIQWFNEPWDAREAANSKWPPKDQDAAWRILADRWNEAARLIVERGAIAGFPDGPCYDRNPFTELGDPNGFWQDGQAVYLGHFYGKGRPVDYPEDDVSHYGTPLTMDEYRAALDDYADDPAWNEGPVVLAMMNQQRAAWANPNASPLTDDTCFQGWVKVDAWAIEEFRHPVLMALTEGGWVPRDRAGSNPVDIRWPMTTPKMVGTKTLEMLEAETPLFAICPWLLACADMGGSGWEFDAWHGGAYADKYGLQKPVIATLQQNPPGTTPPPGPQPPPDLTAKFNELRAQFAQIAELWRRIQEVTP